MLLRGEYGIQELCWMAESASELRALPCAERLLCGLLHTIFQNPYLGTHTFAGDYRKEVGKSATLMGSLRKY